MTKRTYKIQPPQVWNRIRQDYLSGDDARTVADRHGVTEAALRARATREGWSRNPRNADTPPLDDVSADALPLPAMDALSAPDGPVHDPADLARAAAQASGRALHAQDFPQARALAALAETYRKLADGDGRGRAARLTLKTAPLQLVFDILTNPDEAERRFAMNTSDKSDWELRGHYWQEKQKLERANNEWGTAQLYRRVQLDRRIAALEAQLREAGLDPVIERERDRRISQGLDLYVGRPRGIISMEEWDKTLDEL
ncbi:hypothetical protein [Brevundimonas sp.]|uniref:hypothetical protein n=1 Tax=Brevundimonas sp. TaxID=1871086 RepID=UPI003D0E49AA